MEAHIRALQGLPEAVVFLTEDVRSKSAKAQKLCYTMESQTDSIYGDWDKNLLNFCYFLVTGTILKGLAFGFLVGWLVVFYTQYST